MENKSVSMQEALKEWKSSKQSFQFTCPKCGSHHVILKKGEVTDLPKSNLAAAISSFGSNKKGSPLPFLKRSFKLYCQDCHHSILVHI